MKRIRTEAKVMAQEIGLMLSGGEEGGSGGGYAPNGERIISADEMMGAMGSMLWQ